MSTSTPSNNSDWRQERSPKLDVVIEIDADLTILRCQGRITYGPESWLLSEQLSRLVNVSTQLILDLNGVVAMDSAGLGELALMVTRARVVGCDIKVAAPPDNIRRLLELTNLSTILEIYPTFHDALKVCRQSV